MARFEFTLEDITSAMERAGFKVLTLDNLDEWPEPDHSQMKAAIAAHSRKLAESIDAEVLANIIRSQKES